MALSSRTTAMANTDQTVNAIHKDSKYLQTNISLILEKIVCITGEAQRTCQKYEQHQKHLESVVVDSKKDVSTEEKKLQQINDRVEQARRELENAKARMAVFTGTGAASAVGAIATAPTLIGPLLFGAGYIVSAVLLVDAAKDSSNALSKGQSHKDDARCQTSEVEKAKSEYKNAKKERDENEKLLRDKKLTSEACKQQQKFTADLDPRFKRIHNWISRLKGKFEINLLSFKECDEEEQTTRLKNIIKATQDLGTLVKEELEKLPEYAAYQNNSSLVKYPEDYKDTVVSLKQNVTCLLETIDKLQCFIDYGTHQVTA